MSSFLDKITQFLTSLFNQDPEEARRKKARGQILDDLKQIKPPLFKAATGEVLPALGTAVFNLYNIIFPINEILEKTILNSDKNIARHFKTYLISRNLPSEVGDVRLIISHDALKARISQAADPLKEMKFVTDAFREAMNRINKNDEQLLTMELTHLYRLAELCRLDYPSFLRKMDPGINISDPKYKPSFKSIKGDSVIPFLMDIYYVASPLSLEAGIENNLHLLIEKISSDNLTEKQKLISRNLALLGRLFKRHLAPVNLSNLLCALKDEPFFKPPVDRETQEEVVKEYKESMESEFRKSREKIEREMQNSSLQTHLKELFPNGKLEVIESYNDENARQISETSGEELTHCRPLAILKSYVDMKYGPALRDHLGKIIVEGFFEDKNFQQRINDAFYACEEASKRIGTFENGMTDDRGASIQTVFTYMEGLRKGKDLHASLSQVINTINQRAAELIETETNNFYRLGNMIVEIVEEYKSRNPSKISNIRTIGGNSNRELVAQIVNGYNDLARFIKIMKNYTMVRSADAAQGRRDTEEI